MLRRVWLLLLLLGIFLGAHCAFVHRAQAQTEQERVAALRMEDRVWASVAQVLAPRVRNILGRVLGAEAASALVAAHGLAGAGFTVSQIQPLAIEFAALLQDQDLIETLWNTFILTPQGMPFAADTGYHSNFLIHTQQLHAILANLAERNRLTPQIVDAFLQRPDATRSVAQVSTGFLPEMRLVFRNAAAEAAAHSEIVRFFETYGALTRAEVTDESTVTDPRENWDSLFDAYPNQAELWGALPSDPVFEPLRTAFRAEVHRLLRTEDYVDGFLTHDAVRVLASFADLSKSIQGWLHAHIASPAIRGRVAPMVLRYFDRFLQPFFQAVRRRIHSQPVESSRILVESRFKILEMLFGGFTSYECTGGGMPQNPQAIQALDAAQDLLADKVYTLISTPDGNHQGSMVIFRVVPPDPGSSDWIAFTSGMRSLTAAQRRGILMQLVALYPRTSILVGSRDHMDNSGIHADARKDFAGLIPAVFQGHRALRLPGFQHLVEASTRDADEQPYIPGLRGGGVDFRGGELPGAGASRCRQYRVVVRASAAHLERDAWMEWLGGVLEKNSSERI